MWYYNIFYSILPSLYRWLKKSLLPLCSLSVDRLECFFIAWLFLYASVAVYSVTKAFSYLLYSQCATHKYELHYPSTVSELHADRTEFFLWQNPVRNHHRCKIVYRYVTEEINFHDSAVSLPNIFGSKKTSQQWFPETFVKSNGVRSTSSWPWCFLSWSQSWLDFFYFPQLSVCLLPGKKDNSKRIERSW